MDRRSLHDIPAAAASIAGRWPARVPLPQPARAASALPLVVLSNRQPWVHERADDGSITVRRPAGGLVTGIEPLLRSRGGTWIAHGSGSGDAETVGADGTIAVPPNAPAYALKRLFLTAAEVSGYYEGFANEALWPLCHRVHQRPVFRAGDWSRYRAVNERFAAAAADAAGAGAPILVQDYHLALVPRLVRGRAAGAKVSIFWHIPWPGPDAFEICPHAPDLLDGLLGADVIGFHTDEYGENFLQCAEQLLPGCVVDLRAKDVVFRGRRTRIRTYPISVEWPYPAASRPEGARLRKELGLSEALHVAVSVDRADYTKGLLERVRAIETLFEVSPDLRGRYTHVQVAAPSRQTIGPYRDLLADLQREVARVNERFGRARWRPLLLRADALAPDEVRRHYAMADSALVTPLHDGMNLVAKEYVASCADGQGALVLSRYAGAAVELRDALLVNPYDPRGVAEAIIRSVHMPPLERLRRMHAMRAAIARNTIDDWAAALLDDLASAGGREIASGLLNVR